MPVMLKDIAEKAGVSPTTVSLVLNPHSQHRISQKTQQKIFQIAEELGFRPENKTSPRSQKIETIVSDLPLTIGFVVPDIKNPFFTELADVVEEIAGYYGYNIILCNTRSNVEKESEILEVLSRRKVDGLLLAPVDPEHSDLGMILKNNIPVVFIDRRSEKIDASAVILDNALGAYTATNHLLQLQHTRIGIVTARQNTPVGRDRLQGYAKALQEANIPVDESLIQNGDFTIEGGKAAMNTLLSLPSPPSAVLSCAGFMTAGILKEVREHRLTIPRDLSLITFDDHIWMQVLDPPLTAIAQPIADIGKEATLLIIQLIQGWRKMKPQKITLEPKLILRESCAHY